MMMRELSSERTKWSFLVKSIFSPLLSHSILWVSVLLDWTLQLNVAAAPTNTSYSCGLSVILVCTLTNTIYASTSIICTEITVYKRNGNILITFFYKQQFRTLNNLTKWLQNRFSHREILMTRSKLIKKRHWKDIQLNTYTNGLYPKVIHCCSLN